MKGGGFVIDLLRELALFSRSSPSLRPRMSESTSTRKLPYETPRLVRYGDLVQLTASVGMTSPNSDGAPGNGMSKTK